MPNSTPLRLTSTIASQSSTQCSSNGETGMMPALLTRTSSRPKVSTASDTNPARSLRRLTSVTLATASPPDDDSRAATAFNRSARRAPSTSLAPRSASRSAVASPIPLLAPVIATTLPSIVTGPKLRADARPKLSTVASIDLNADLGEGFGVWRLGDDEAMLGIVTSANVACGFHAGDPAGLLTVCRLAAERGVRIGAQVSYRDLAGFGRRFIDVTHGDLLADVIYQIGALQGLAQVAGSAVSYVKPHGALYNTIVTNREQAAAVAEAVRTVDAGLPVLGLGNSVFFDEARQRGLRTVPEAFADRAYRANGQLVSRREPGAGVNEPAAIAERVLAMTTAATVTAVDGSTVALQVESVCVHGDSPGAVQIASAVADRLKAGGIELKAFC